MQLNREELQLLKKPMGVLINNKQVNLDYLSQYLEVELIISVGDATTDKLFELGIVPAIQIVDGKERRIERNLPLENYVKVIRCNNPAGAISIEAINAFREALASEKPVRILVDGEEDLIGAIVLALAPDYSILFYGQPLEGLVIVRIDNEARRKLKQIINKIRLSLN